MLDSIDKTHKTDPQITLFLSFFPSSQHLKPTMVIPRLVWLYVEWVWKDCMTQNKNDPQSQKFYA